MKKTFYLSLILIAMFLSRGGYAQIVTPFLDPGLASESPSAVSWRFGSTSGLETAFGNQRDQGKKSYTIGKYKNTGVGVVVALQPSHVTGELSYRENEVRYDPIYFIDGEGKTDFSLEKVKLSSGRFHLAIRGENQFSVGIGVSRLTEDRGGEDTNKSSYTGSFGLRFLDGWFLSGGLEQGQTAVDGFDNLKWQIFFGGFALQLGNPMGTMMRLEGGVRSSSEESTENSLQEIYYHPKFMESLGSFEVLAEGYLLSVTYSKRDTQSVDSTLGDTSRQKTRYGLGFRNIGLSLMLYGSRTIEKCDGAKNESDEIRLTLSYSYI